MRIATLGPKGTFSHEAVLKHDSKAEIIFTDTIWDVFEKVNTGEVDQGIVPIENSISGNVGITFGALIQYHLKIYAEILVPIRHYLVGNSKDITHLYSHPESFAQCQHYINKHLPNVEHLPTSSNAKSAEKLARNKRKGTGAIVPYLGMKSHGLTCIKENIQDNPDNTTRFFVLDTKCQKSTGQDRTSVIYSVKSDKPGQLQRLAKIFSDRKINLTKIDSLPSKGKLGKYLFYLDFEGHMDDDIVKDAFSHLDKEFTFRILGSYPRVY